MTTALYVLAIVAMLLFAYATVVWLQLAIVMHSAAALALTVTNLALLTFISVGLAAGHYGFSVRWYWMALLLVLAVTQFAMSRGAIYSRIVCWLFRVGCDGVQSGGQDDVEW